MLRHYAYQSQQLHKLFHQNTNYLVLWYWMWNKTGKFQTPQPLYETLSHSNGKVVFDHGPNVIELQNTLCEPSLKQSYKI